MLKIIANSFKFKNIFNLRNHPLNQFVLYFLLLVFIISFPLNYQIIKTGGWDLYNFSAGMRQSYPDWLPSQLPEDIEISKSGMYYETAVVTTLTTTNLDNETLNIVFMPFEEYTISDRSLVFEPERIVYYDVEGKQVLEVGYSNITTLVRFADLRMMTQSEAVSRFANMIDEAFSSYAIFVSVVYYTGITAFLNLVLILVVSAIFIFVRIRFQKVTKFTDNLKIVIASMTIPSLISFIVGIAGIMEINAFTVVIYQFATPLIALISIFKGSKIKEISNKNV
jgi:maltodextrin utilization protein YvdJ